MSDPSSSPSPFLTAFMAWRVRSDEEQEEVELMARLAAIQFRPYMSSTSCRSLFTLSPRDPFESETQNAFVNLSHTTLYHDTTSQGSSDTVWRCRINR